jgi:hypothetical protein
MHLYLGLFFAPTILFFAITGGLQMFGLHETARGSSYVPPNILVHLSQLHKKGTLYLSPRKVPPPTPNSAESDGAKLDGPKLETPKPTQAPPPPNSLPMKIFFAATALALAVSTCTGLIMGWKYARRKSVRSAHPCGRSCYSGYPVLGLDFPDSSIAEWTQMTERHLAASCSMRIVNQNALP